MTSPDVMDVQKYLAQAKAQGCHIAVLETASHGLDQDRFHGIDWCPFLMGKRSDEESGKCMIVDRKWNMLESSVVFHVLLCALRACLHHVRMFSEGLLPMIDRAVSPLGLSNWSEETHFLDPIDAGSILDLRESESVCGD